MIWSPCVTVAAVIHRDGRFLMVEEETPDGVRLNQPAGHLEPRESLRDAVVRETLEETARELIPGSLIGVYRWQVPPTTQGPTYLRFCFEGVCGEPLPSRPLDAGILRTLWLGRDELAARPRRLRSPLVLRCIDDFLRGCRYPLAVLTDLE